MVGDGGHGMRHDEDPGSSLAPVEVVASRSSEGGGDGAQVHVRVMGGPARVRVRGCAGMGCCMAWLALLGLGLLVGVMWLVKAIWVRL